MKIVGLAVRRALLVGVVAIGATHAEGQTANLVKNGNFEDLTNGFGQVVINGNGSQLTTGTNVTSATSWYAPRINGNGYPGLFFTDNGVSRGYNYAYDTTNRYLFGTTSWDGTSSQGGSYLVMAAADYVTSVGTLSQKIDGLTVGQSYDLSFSWAAAESKSLYGSNEAAYRASISAMIDGQTYATPTANVAAAGFGGWTTAVYSFTYRGGSDVLSFQAAGSPAYAQPMVLLDGVSLALTPSVPEPATWAMMLIGFSMVAGVARYRRRCGMKITYTS
ncbi:PEPxxWA-CTERM sorting domain-containing protein [uncultured Sphingomonas sp.]|uniref:PEPxxWA-CTERM sorting domain-containing protein n=1 Tax=uncultured Sphingomonas sp. TaxID=158754 RepID=UPI0030F9CAE7